MKATERPQRNGIAGSDRTPLIVRIWMNTVVMMSKNAIAAGGVDTRASIVGVKNHGDVMTARNQRRKRRRGLGEKMIN